ncbi:MAG: hypothetical protein KatS3mg042_0946 [Rhodothermaceae bacterium]|nr:MAG: hypothetical protein KatS3mg042_0946 [Rhodothermaceae bacterium]
MSEDLTVADENDPGRIKLFRRSSTAGLEPWGMVAAATGVDAEANTVTFSGVTSFGQFVLGRSGTPEPVSGTLLSFDGVDDRAHAATNLNLGATDITVEAWVRRGSTDTNDFFFSYGDVGEGRNQGLSMGYRPTNVFAFGFAGGNDLDTPVAYTDTGWHHWAGVYVRSTGERRLYRDGVLVASDVTGEPFEEVDDPELFLGRFFLQANSDFGGDLEELRIWNTARTEAEIREAMHRTLAGTETGLVAYWQFNEATGTTVADVVGGHDLTLQNGTAWAESDVPVAGGVSVTRTEAAGLVDFSAAGVTMNYSSQSGAQVTVTRLGAAPSSLPAGGSVETVLDSQYWIIERDGAGGFDADVTFTVAEDLTGDVAGRLLLFRRDSRDGADAPWEQVGTADSLDAATGTITFRGLTEFSQFVIVRAPAAQAVPGTRLTFDGVDDYVEIPDAPDLAFDRDSSYTVETWVRYTGTGGSGSGDGAIIEKWSGGAASYPFVLRVNRQEPGQVYCAVWDQSTSISSRSRGNLNDGAWHHLACVHDGAKRTLTLYVDGEPQHVVSTASVGSLANTHPIYFGRRGGHLNEWFGGDLEEVRIWRVARTQTDVREAMHRTMTGTEPGLVAYWQLNEGAGTTAADIISGHDGALNGGTAWAASDTPVGGGASASATAALGPVDFAAPGLTITFTANTTADPITVTRLDLDPSDAPGGAALTFLDGRYWVVERFGTGTFTADLTFTVDGLTAGDAADPGRLKLLRRDSRAAGGTWSVVAHGLAADAVAGTVTFPGVTAFSQYAIARGSTPGTLAGSAADFDGTNHLDVGDLGDFGRRLKTATVSFWMKSVSAVPGSIMKVEVDPATPTAPVFAIEANRLLSAGCTGGDGAGATLFYVRDNAGRVLARHITTDLYDGTWHHVAWVLTDASANQMTVYVDGVAQTLNGTCSQSPATFVDWGQPLFLGAASAAGTAEDHAAVSLDQVRFWTRARTDRQVREAMHHPLTGAEPGLVAYWLFDEGTGSTAADFVGGHDGTFAGGDGWTPATMPFGPGVFAQETEANGLIDFAGNRPGGRLPRPQRLCRRRRPDRPDPRESAGRDGHRRVRGRLLAPDPLHRRPLLGRPDLQHDGADGRRRRRTRPDQALPPRRQQRRHLDPLGQCRRGGRGRRHGHLRRRLEERAVRPGPRGGSTGRRRHGPRLRRHRRRRARARPRAAQHLHPRDVDQPAERHRRPRLHRQRPRRQRCRPVQRRLLRRHPAGLPPKPDAPGGPPCHRAAAPGRGRRTHRRVVARDGLPQRRTDRPGHAGRRPRRRRHRRGLDPRRQRNHRRNRRRLLRRLARRGPHLDHRPHRRTDSFVDAPGLWRHRGRAARLLAVQRRHGDDGRRPGGRAGRYARGRHRLGALRRAHRRGRRGHPHRGRRPGGLLGHRPPGRLYRPGRRDGLRQPRRRSAQHRSFRRDALRRAVLGPRSLRHRRVYG